MCPSLGAGLGFPCKPCTLLAARYRAPPLGLNPLVQSALGTLRHGGHSEHLVRGFILPTWGSLSHVWDSQG